MTVHVSDPFFQMPTRPRHTSAGEVSVPAFYYDASNLTALFRCPRDQALALLQGTGLEPAYHLGPWTLLAVTLFEYRHTSTGPYNEAGLAIPVVRHGHARLLTSVFDILQDAEDREMGAYLLDLPVTTDLAHAAGKELWGYPKFVTQIPIQREGRRFRGQVFHPQSGQVIFTLAGQVGHGIDLPNTSLLTYSYRDGQLLRTCIDARGPLKACLPGSLSLLVGSSSHPMAERLRALGLHGAKPLLVVRADKLQLRLNEGEPAEI